MTAAYPHANPTPEAPGPAGFGKLCRIALVSVTLLAAPFALAQVPIDQIGPNGITIKGKVVDTFGEKFVLEDASGRILVEMRVAPDKAPALTQGETVLVTGLPRNRIFDARRVARESGEVIFTDTEPAPAVASVPPAADQPDGKLPRAPAAIPTATSLTADGIASFLRSLALTPVGEPERKRKHIEIPARTAAGRDVIVSLDRFGRLWEIEDAEHDNKRVPVRLNSTAEADQALRKAGYTPQGEIERRKHHFEVLALNSRGEMVEVHMNLSGHVYRQEWLR
jgi:hypothetical protein